MIQTETSEFIAWSQSMNEPVAARKQIISADAPAAIGPYSQAILSDGLLFCSGQIPLDPQNGTLCKGSLSEQAHRMFKNLQAVAESADTNLSAALKTTLFLTNMDDFVAINKIYQEYFTSPFPARTTVEVTRLPLGALMEIEAVIKVS